MENSHDDKIKAIEQLIRQLRPHKYIDVLGTPYKVYFADIEEDEKLADCDGYFDWSCKEIVVRNKIDGNIGDMEGYKKKVLRHEIIHAFFEESGLAECSVNCDEWARSEEMVDWFARQGPKIFSAWWEAGAME